MPAHVPLKRIHDPSPSNFRDDFLLAERPVIIEGGARPMPAFGRWTDDYLNAILGDVRPTIRVPDGRLARIGFREFLAYLDQPEAYRSSSGPAYLTDFYLRPGWPLLAREAACPLPIDTDGIVEFLLLYAGPRGTTTSMHQDVYATHTWLAELRGTKDWRICEPDALDPDQAWNLDAFGGALDCEVMTATLEPGDVIYLPPNFWHQVRNTSSTLAVTGNFCPTSHAHAALHEATELRDLRANMWSTLLDASAHGAASVGA